MISDRNRITPSKSLRIDGDLVTTLAIGWLMVPVVNIAWPCLPDATDLLPGIGTEVEGASCTFIRG